jgi:1,2-phenylacetyl-CoA epoxidase catalytic subunit
MVKSAELHDLPPERFYEDVHSFEHWFGAVQGYLEGSEYGHRVETPDETLSEAERDRLAGVLSCYCIGETAALEGASGLIRIAPNRPTKVFLSTQTVDEGRHLEVLTHRLLELGVAEDEIERRAHPRLFVFRRRLLELVDGGDWEAALFAQNVVLESMEFATFHRHARLADPRTREVLLGIVKDERRHMGFGENELGRRLGEDPALRQRLHPLHQELDALVLETFDHVMRQLAVPAHQRSELGREYLGAVQRLGFS